MATNVPTFTLDAWVAQELCVWPLCQAPALLWVARKFDGKHMGHCVTHHFNIAFSDKVYGVPTPREHALACWEGEGGCPITMTD